MVSICITTYNGEKFILEQLNSILEQIDEKDEIIITDDDSLDRTREIIEELGDPRIYFYSNQTRLGYTKNFEKALKKSSGDIIFLCDQDDIWTPNKYTTIKLDLIDNDFVVHDAVIVNEKRKVLFPSFFNWRGVHFTLFGNIFKFGFLGCCMAFKRSVLEMALPFPKKEKLATFDNWLFLIGIKKFKVKFQKKPLIEYRRHDSNASSGGSTSRKSIVFKINYRIYIILKLTQRIISRKCNLLSKK